MRRAGRQGLLAGVAVLVGALVARAYDTSWISSGQTVSAAKLKTDLDEAQARIAVLETRYRLQGGTTSVETFSAAMDSEFFDVNVVPDPMAFMTYDTGAPTDGAQVLGAGIQFTPPRTGVYRVTCLFTAGTAGPSAINVLWRLSDGNADSGATPVHNAPSIQHILNSNGGAYSPISLSWGFELTGGSPVTVRLQLLRQNTGAAVEGGGLSTAMTWNVEEL